MRSTLPLILCTTLTLTGCATISGSRLNPLNWFGQSTEAQVTETGELRPLTPQNRKTKIVDSRSLIATVSDLRIERTASGAIVRATGTTAVQGAFNAELVEVSNTGSVLTYAFRVEKSSGLTGVGPQASRRIVAAKALSTADLAGIRTIRVQGANNARSAAR